MFDDIPENYKAQTADNEEEGWRYTQGDKNARRPPELLTRDHVAAASCAKSRRAAAVRTAACSRHRLDQGHAAERGRAHQEEAAEHVPPVQAARRHRHHQGADGSRPDDPLHHGRRAGRRRHADVDRARPVRRRRVRGRHQRRQSPRRQLAVGSLVFGKRAGEFAAQFAKDRASRLDRRGRVGRGRAARARAVRPRRLRARARIRCSTRCRT